MKAIPSSQDTILYRGWILTGEQYALLFRELADRGLSLVSSPEQYSSVNEFPNYYPLVRDCSPQSVWTRSTDPYGAWSASRKLGDGPFVLKDYVKSAKHRWHDACYVPERCGRERFEEIAANLKEEQGASFNGGYVVKSYVPLKKIATGPMEYPRCEEYRLFFWKGALLVSAHYHRNPMSEPPLERFAEFALRFESPFYTMDIAMTERPEDGDWIIVDMGAGEVSSLPPDLSPERFYSLLVNC